MGEKKKELLKQNLFLPIHSLLLRSLRAPPQTPHQCYSVNQQHLSLFNLSLRAQEVCPPFTAFSPFIHPARIHSVPGTEQTLRICGPIPQNLNEEAYNVAKSLSISGATSLAS